MKLKFILLSLAFLFLISRASKTINIIDDDEEVDDQRDQDLQKQRNQRNLDREQRLKENQERQEKHRIQREKKREEFRKRREEFAQKMKSRDIDIDDDFDRDSDLLDMERRLHDENIDQDIMDRREEMRKRRRSLDDDFDSDIDERIKRKREQFESDMMNPDMMNDDMRYMENRRDQKLEELRNRPGRHRMDMQDQFGKNNKEGQKMKKVLISQNERLTQPILDYINSGKSKFNWEITYSRRQKENDLQLIFGDRRNRISSSQDEAMSNVLDNEFYKVYEEQDKLVSILNKFDKVSKLPVKSSSFIPKTYTIHHGFQEFIKEEQDFINLKSDDNIIWVEKPKNSSNGRGIRVHTKIERLQETIRQRKKRGKEGSIEQADPKMHIGHISRTTIVQEYIQNPILRDNKKCDVRYHILQIFTGKNWLYFMNDSYSRCSLKEYQLNDRSSDSHITNNSKTEMKKDRVGRENSNNSNDLTQELSDIQITSQEYKQFLKTEKYDADQMFKKADEYLLYTFLSGQEQINAQKGYYNLWGADVLFDTEGNPWIIDIEHQPELHTWTPAKEKVIPELTQNFIEILMALQDNWDDMDKFSSKNSNIPNGNFRLVYNEASKQSPFSKTKHDDL